MIKRIIAMEDLIKIASHALNRLNKNKRAINIWIKSLGDMIFCLVSFLNAYSFKFLTTLPDIHVNTWTVRLHGLRFTDWTGEWSYNYARQSYEPHKYG